MTIFSNLLMDHMKDDILCLGADLGTLDGCVGFLLLSLSQLATSIMVQNGQFAADNADVHFVCLDSAYTIPLCTLLTTANQQKNVQVLQRGQASMTVILLCSWLFSAMEELQSGAGEVAIAAGTS